MTFYALFLPFAAALFAPALMWTSSSVHDDFDFIRSRESLWYTEYMMAGFRGGDGVIGGIKAW
jgi:hypothetical protein